MSRIPKPQAISTQMERAMREHFGGGSTSSGVSVSSDTAMKQATVYSCVNILSRVIGMLPCHMMEKKGKNKELAEDFYLYPLLHDMPNEWMTAPELWGMVMNHLLLRGNFYALKNRGLNKLTGKVLEIIPLAPNVVQEVKQNPDYTLTYRCQYPDGTLVDIPGSEIMHLRGMVSNGYMGINPIQYIRESVGLGLAAEKLGARLFQNGTNISMVVEHPGTLKDPGALREALTEVYAGLGNSHKIMLLEEGMKAQKVTIDPRDSQFLELRTYQKSEIVDIFFAMPLTVMTTGDNTPTFASSEQFSIGFNVYACTPWLVTIEKGIYRDLLTPMERKTYYAKFQVNGIMRGSAAERAAYYRELVNCEVICPNEARQWEDLNPYLGGDEYRSRTSSMKQDINTSTTGEKGAAA